MPEPPTVVPWQTLYDLAGMLSRERHQQIRSLRLMQAAVIAAAGQVRDTRLDRLENPTPLPNPNLWADMIFELALMPLAGALVQKGVRALAGRIIAPRLSPKLLLTTTTTTTTTRTTWTKVSWFADGYRADQKVIQKTEQLLSAPADNPLRKVWNGLPKGVADVSKSALKTYREAKPHEEKLPATWRTPLEQDSPASRIEEAILGGLAQQEMTIGVLFDEWDTYIKMANLGAEKITETHEFLAQLAALPQPGTNDLRNLRLFYEACIWCIMYPKITEIKRPSPIRVHQDYSFERTGSSDLVEEIAQPPRTKLLIDIELAEYLVRRLPHPQGLERPEGVETFAEYAAQRSGGKKESEPSGAAPSSVRPSDGSRGDKLREYVDTGKELFDKAAAEEARKVAQNGVLIDKNGKPVNERDFWFPISAYAELGIYFTKLNYNMRETLGDLRQQPPVMYSGVDPVSRLGLPLW